MIVVWFYDLDVSTLSWIGRVHFYIIH